MQTTEAEAKKARCYRDLSSACVGTLCMAWRWSDPAEEIEIFKAGETDAGFAKRRDATLAKRRGYCGAAGVPLGAA